jgi:hypothetical protein
LKADVRSTAGWTLFGGGVMEVVGPMGHCWRKCSIIDLFIDIAVELVSDWKAAKWPLLGEAVGWPVL